MADHYQARSASLSGADNGGDASSYLANSSILQKNPVGGTGLRSVSIGSALYSGEIPSLYSKNELSNTSSSSVEEEAQTHGGNSISNGNLDMVDAFGSLNLDSILNGQKSDLSDSEGIRLQDVNDSSNGPVFKHHQIFQGDSSFYPNNAYYSNSGSMTPNLGSSSMGASNLLSPTFASIRTPSNTWKSPYIASSAPSLTTAHNTPSSVPDIPLQVKPFELPEESKKELSNIGASNNYVSSLNMKFNSSPPLDRFGGELNSKYGLNGSSFDVIPETYMDGVYKFKDTSSPETDVDNSRALHNGRLSPPKNAYNSTIGIDMKPFSEYPMFVAQEVSQNQHKSASSVSRNGVVGNSFAQYNSQPNHYLNNMWVGNSQPQRGNGRQNGNQFFNGRFNNNGRNYYQGERGSQNNSSENIVSSNRRSHYNEGANMHRKGHNSRKKLDDASKYLNAKLEDFTGNIYMLCKDQHGCRFLQKQLDLDKNSNIPEGLKEDDSSKRSSVVATVIFNEIYTKIVELMTDSFGNYLVQKLIESVSVDQRIILVKNSASQLFKIALDPHGTRALQKLVECISTEEEFRLIVNSLSPYVVSLSRDLNGNHVVQKCLQKLKAEDNQFIFDSASEHCFEIATHRHGCCVLQRCLDYGNSYQRKQLSSEVAKNAISLSLDPFGNYVVQYVLAKGDSDSVKIVLSSISKNIMMLSVHKFGSNVIEKSLRISKISELLIHELMNYTDRFSDMLNDPYGNYVLQTSLDVARGKDLNMLCQSLQPLLSSIKNTPHGRRIMTKIQGLSV